MDPMDDMDRMDAQRTASHQHLCVFFQWLLAVRGAARYAARLFFHE